MMVMISHTYAQHIDIIDIINMHECMLPKLARLRLGATSTTQHLAQEGPSYKLAIITSMADEPAHAHETMEGQLDLSCNHHPLPGNHHRLPGGDVALTSTIDSMQLCKLYHRTPGTVLIKVTGYRICPPCFNEVKVKESRSR